MGKKCYGMMTMMTIKKDNARGFGDVDKRPTFLSDERSA